MKHRCICCLGVQRGAEPAPSQGTPPTRSWAALLYQQARAFSHRRAEGNLHMQQENKKWVFASALSVGACERIPMPLPHLAAKSKEKCPFVQGSKQAPVETATCASYRPFETTYSLWKINFTRGFLPGLPMLTRSFACLHDHFHLVRLCHFFSPVVGGKEHWDTRATPQRRWRVPGPCPNAGIPHGNCVWSSAQSLGAPELPPCSVPSAGPIQPSVALSQEGFFHLK